MTWPVKKPASLSSPVAVARPLVGVRGHDLGHHLGRGESAAMASNPLAGGDGRRVAPAVGQQLGEDRLGLGGRQLAAGLHREQRGEGAGIELPAPPRRRPPPRWPPGPGRAGRRATLDGRGDEVVEALVDHRQHLVAWAARGARHRAAAEQPARRSAGRGPSAAATSSCQRLPGPRGRGRARGSSGSRRPPPSSAW